MRQIAAGLFVSLDGVVHLTYTPASFPTPGTGRPSSR
jgi:hypothetical protein